MATFAQQMVDKLQALLLENPGAKEVEVDGQRIAYDDCVKRLTHFERRVAIETGRKPKCSSLYLGGF